MAILHRQAQRIGALVGQLLELAELDARPAQMQSERLELRELVEQVAATARDRAEGATIRADVTGMPSMLGNANALERALDNLVDNAVKHAGPNANVRISARTSDGRVEVAVADDGPGIPEQHLPRVFERFYRVDPARSRDSGGAGLGLAIVDELVRGMGGSIDIESGPTGGTRVRMRFAAGGDRAP